MTTLVAELKAEESGAASGVITRLPCVQPFQSLLLPLSLHQMHQIARTYSKYIESKTLLMQLPKFRFRAKKPHQRVSCFCF